ncbi:hypothetical protein JTB14_029900 [Gonioctena quinquepunctata]|nr:hypothetical protein JTB14_029900 [Gonioctena quinquepunctata]
MLLKQRNKELNHRINKLKLVTISDDRQEIVEFQDEDENIDTSHNEQSAVQETKPIEAQHVENRINRKYCKSNVGPVPEGNLNQEIIECPGQNVSSYTIADDMPSPFRGSFILHQTKLKNVKKRLVKETLLSVISGKKGKQYFKKKEDEHTRKELEKAERKRKRGK